MEMFMTSALRKYNPFPPAVWVFLFLTFISGYFTGAVVQSIAVEQNKQKTCDYLRKFKKPLLPF